MSRSAILCITFGFAAGVTARSFFDFGPAGPVFLVLVSLVSLTQSFIVPIGRRRIWRAVALFCLLAGAGVIRFEFKDQSEIARTLGEPTSAVALTGLVVSEPDRRETRTQLVFRPDDWPIRVLLLVPPYPEFDYGDRLAVTGELVRIKNFQAEETGRLVAYSNYLAVREIYFQMFDPAVKLLAQEQGRWLKRQLSRLKTVWLERLAQTVPEPEASLLGGLVFGARQSLGREWHERLREVGLVHIVVLSGYNLSAVAAAFLAVFGCLRGVPRRFGLGLAALAVGLFTLMVGAGAATVRAAIMALIALLARATGRTYAVWRALILAALIMIVVNPKVLVFDAGFQLSFLATAGLIHLTPRFEKRLHFVPVTLGLRSLLATTVAAQLAVLPWLLVVAGQLPWLALPANLLVLPVVPAAMLFGFLTALLPPLGGLIWLAAAPAWLLAAYILGLTRFFSGLF